MSADLNACECGHVERMHSVFEQYRECRACPCDGYAPSADPEAAIEAGAARKRERVERARAARREALE